MGDEIFFSILFGIIILFGSLGIYWAYKEAED